MIGTGSPQASLSRSPSLRSRPLRLCLSGPTGGLAKLSLATVTQIRSPEFASTSGGRLKLNLASSESSTLRSAIRVADSDINLSDRDGNEPERHGSSAFPPGPIPPWSAGSVGNYPSGERAI